ncbi:cation-transporting ATPase 13A3/4/5 [Nematocida displodere]|uniref:Cation-transporting ATPase 13A3/4/5 n=1 Tax=Nematocida displodere TaxID=1805483 RepID=A0A177EFU6_9MICR|nr:cation-transporting ATPase 13A3/4/5 [Nematocida displodere]
MAQLLKERTEEHPIRGRVMRFPRAMYYIVSVLSLGIFHIICTFFPRVRLVFECKTSLHEKANVVEYRNHILNVHTERVKSQETSEIADDYIRNGIFRYIFVLHERRIFNWSTRVYEIPQVDRDIDGLTRKEREIFFGKNMLVSQIDPPGIVLFNTTFTVVNVYTLFGIFLWIKIGYIVYALIIFVLMMYTVITETSREIKANAAKKQASRMKNVSYLLTNGIAEPISSADIILGDVLLLIPFLEVPCDCQVLQGTLAVDEGFVTGESVPVLKKEGAEVLGGTTVLQAHAEGGEALCAEIEEFIQSGSFAIVRAVKTSFSSTKGKALKNLAEQKITLPPLYYDTIKIIGITASVAAPFLLGLLIYMDRKGLVFAVGKYYALDLLYAIVSPSIPTTIWIGMSLCSKRLERIGVICKNLSVTNISGNITRVCFDKTGTLTEEGLDVKLICINGEEFFTIDDMPPRAALGVRACHSAESVGERTLGDPLDIKLLHFSRSRVAYVASQTGRKRAIYTEDEHQGTILQVFGFDPNTRRMSTVIDTPNGFFFFTKGSPETIETLCDPSTVPDSYFQVIDKYSMEGYRIIALAGKSIENPLLDRESLETGLELLSIIVFENKLKKETTSTISALSGSGIDSVMCTGDSLLTAVSVAMQCGIVEKHVPVIYPIRTGDQDVTELTWKCINDDVVLDKDILKVRKGKDYTSYIDFVVAVEGNLFDLLIQSPDYRRLVKKRCKVFSRMNPSQKSAVVNFYKESGLVCFVGDGANDCNAIQSADVGISLCSADGTTGEFCVSSYVVYRKEITSLLSIIKEGKSTSVTTINKIEQILTITITQFIALCVLQTQLLFMSDRQNIYSDILISIPLSILMSRFKSSRQMSTKRPKQRIFIKSILLKMALHCSVHFIHLYACIHILRSIENKYIGPPYKLGHLSEVSQIGTGTFFLFNFQILYSGFCYTSGAPFRERKSKNLSFVFFYLAHITILSTFLISVTNAAKDHPQAIWLRKLLDLCPLEPNSVFVILTVFLSDAFFISFISKVIKALLT